MFALAATALRGVLASVISIDKSVVVAAVAGSKLQRGPAGGGEVRGKEGGSLGQAQHTSIMPSSSAGRARLDKAGRGGPQTIHQETPQSADNDRR